LLFCLLKKLRKKENINRSMKYVKRKFIHFHTIDD